MSAYIFLCNNKTEPECFKRKLFGGTEKYRARTKNLKKGDLLFLYNREKGFLYGTFQATSEPAMNIQVDAWQGEFPWQVEVQQINEHPPLSRLDFKSILAIKFDRAARPSSALSEMTALELERLFISLERVPLEERDYRTEFPPQKFTDDGHVVRSEGELAIDNWLFAHRIVHGYESQVPEVQGTLLCDFFIPLPNSEKRIYIEFWGKEDAKYKQRQDYKTSLYKKYGLELIEIYPDDIKKLDAALSTILLLLKDKSLSISGN